MDGLRMEPLGRVLALLTRVNQCKILEEIFAQTLQPTRLQQPSCAKPERVRAATVLPPGTPPPMVVPLQPTSDPKPSGNALALVEDLPASDFKSPTGQNPGVKGNDYAYYTSAARSLGREELLPVEELLKLLTWDNDECARLAMLHWYSQGLRRYQTLEAY
jgi:hypothetical protein